jgi:Rrf2 family protein
VRVPGAAVSENAGVRISTKAEYALRAMAQLAADAHDGPVTATRMAEEQQISTKFLHAVLTELKRARLVRSVRGPDGGFELARPGTEITLADVLRAVDGPLVNVHDTSVSTLTYPGPAHALVDVWKAARVSMRNVFERVTIADLATGELPEPVAALAVEYAEDVRYP